ncbi:MAG: NACHT domain-containing protein [Symploca sp. SIO2E6]|nr:NACHT domain-containing protein [Symploca sp. SIO2E6]
MLIPQEFLQKIASSYGVSDRELKVLSEALQQGGNLDEIAHRLQIQPQAARKRLGEVYKKFGIGGRGPGKLAQLQQYLSAEYQKQQQFSPVAAATSASACDWGSAPEVEPFYGRGKELQQLQDWLTYGCRLIAITGLAGMGKTWLAVKLVQAVESEFEFIIWRSLDYQPHLTELLADWLSILAPSREDTLNDLNRQLAQLMSCLKTTRVLLILDDLAEIFSQGQLAGNYDSEFTDYGILLERMATERHCSCLLLISSEKLTEWVRIEGQKVKSLELKGSPEVAWEILQEKGIAKSPEWQELIRLHQGNPLAVKMVASNLLNLYQEQVSEFLQQEISLSRSLSQSTYLTRLLEEQFERFADAEKYLVYWLAIQKQAMRTEQLQIFWQRIPLDEHSFLPTLSSLHRRSLLEKSQAGFRLPRMSRRFFVNKLVEEILDAIRQLISPIVDEVIFPVLSYYPISDCLDDAVESLLPQLTGKLAVNLQKHPQNWEHFKNAIAKLQEVSVSSLGYCVQNLEILVTHVKD